ncbi:MAG: right-handed parallel beta-helix repeat-containing protein [Planctomycetota bacterium]|jgi:hypothetical protein
MRATPPGIRLLTAVFLLATVGMAAGRTITVDDDGPADFDNIQAAIDDANDGDTVIVQPGTYTGEGNRDIDFLGKAITVRSEDAPENCVIDCQGSIAEPHRGFRFVNNETAESVVDGFMIVGGYSPTEDVGGYDYEVGGAIFCHSSGPTIRNCILRGNEADYWGGGGIYCVDGSPAISNTLFEGNHGHTGGGILCDNSEIAIDGCIFTGNWGIYAGICLRGNCNGRIVTSSIIGNGGTGIGCYRSQLTLDRCLIVSNNAGGGGGMWASQSNVDFRNCMIANNTVTYYGGGIEFVGRRWEDNILTMTGCTVVGNRAGKRGGGILATDYVEAIISNSILWGNVAREGQQLSLYATSHVGGTSTAQLFYCVLDGGIEGVYYPSHGGHKVTADNCIDVDPLFGPNYHLQEGSPCIDAGDPNYVAGPNETDLDGNQRVVDGDSDGNSVIDIGAYEYFVPPIEVYMKFTPQALNPYSSGRWVKAHFVLPEEFTIDDVDTNKPAKVSEPFEPHVESEYMKVFVNNDGLVEIEAAFGRGDFCASGIGGNSEVTVVGSFTTGQQFYGTETIRITTNYLKFLADLAFHWLQTDCGKPDWCGGVDLDQNSRVDFVDFALFDGCCIEVITE